MIEQLSRFDNIFYAVFERKNGGEKAEKEGEEKQEEEEEEEWEGGKEEWEGGKGEEVEDLGELVGSVSLRLQHVGPSLPPPPLIPTPRHDGKPSASTSIPVSANLNLRALGYAFFDSARGRGYATEANRGLLEAYRSSIPAEQKAVTRFYVEAEVDQDNPGSVRVLQKLGFGQVGWKDEERVWLNGGWRTGHWVYGRDV